MTFDEERETGRAWKAREDVRQLLADLHVAQSKADTLPVNGVWNQMLGLLTMAIDILNALEDMPEYDAGELWDQAESKLRPEAIGTVLAHELGCEVTDNFDRRRWFEIAMRLHGESYAGVELTQRLYHAAVYTTKVV